MLFRFCKYHVTYMLTIWLLVLSSNAGIHWMYSLQLCQICLCYLIRTSFLLWGIFVNTWSNWVLIGVDNNLWFVIDDLWIGLLWCSFMMISVLLVKSVISGIINLLFCTPAYVHVHVREYYKMAILLFLLQFCCDLVTSCSLHHASNFFTFLLFHRIQ